MSVEVNEGCAHVSGLVRSYFLCKLILILILVELGARF
jgi:hypothetical protein